MWSCTSTGSKETVAVIDSVRESAVSDARKLEEEKKLAAFRNEKLYQELNEKRKSIEKNLYNETQYKLLILYSSELLNTEETNSSASERFEVTGTVSFQFLKDFKLRAVILSLSENYVSVGGEEAYEYSNPLLSTTIYYDTANAIELVENSGLLASRNDTVMIANREEKRIQTYFPLPLLVEVPDFKDIFSGIDFSHITFQGDKKDYYNDYSIRTAYSDQIHKKGLETLLTNLNSMEEYIKKNPSAVNWLPQKSYHWSAVDSKNQKFNPDKGEVRFSTKSGNLLDFLNTKLKETGLIKEFAYDTLHYNYRSTESGSSMNKVSVQPTVTIGSQKWLAVNAGYIYPHAILGKRYSFNNIDEACPRGWHVPSKEEWETMFQYLGGYDAAAKALVSDNPVYWTNTNHDNNSSGFNVIQDYETKNSEIFITATGYSTDEMITIKFSQESGSPTVSLYNRPKGGSFHCRCLSD